MKKSQLWTGGKGEEYETQHFGFGVQRFQIAIREMIEQKVTNGVRDMESYLQETLDLNDTDKVTLTHCCDKLLRLYNERAVPSLEIVDQEIENMLKVPSFVVLPEDDVQAEEISNEEYEKLKTEVSDLRRLVERGALMEALLMAEEEELNSVEKVCEIAKKDIEELDVLAKNIKNSDIYDLLKETKALCDKTPFMQKTEEQDQVKDNHIFDEI